MMLMIRCTEIGAGGSTSRHLVAMITKSNVYLVVRALPSTSIALQTLEEVGARECYQLVVARDGGKP